jgi:FkbM family methyltransferase
MTEPDRLARAVLALTRLMPNNVIGRHGAKLLRRPVMRRLGRKGALEVERWGLTLRLHPGDNGCEKNLLFTPQMFEPLECGALLDRIRSAPAPFVFVDLGANVGLFSLFVAAHAPGARIVAVEPDAQSLARFAHNAGANGLAIEPLPVALAAREGTARLHIDEKDRGGSHTGGADGIPVPAVPLLAVVGELPRIDAMKIDIEGMERAVLEPFFRAAPARLHPALLIVEIGRQDSDDLLALLAGFGYRATGRTRQNAILRRQP